MSVNNGRFGVGLRRPHYNTIVDHHPGVDFFEILPENYMRFGGKPREVLRRALDHVPVVCHGVSLSIGGPDPLSEDYLTRLQELLAWLDPPFFSDHLCYSSAFGVEYHDLIPLPFTEEALRHVVARIDMLQHRMNRRFLLENPSYYTTLGHSEMTELEFLTQVAQAADCGLLLDVNNVYVNAKNHGYDPYAFIDGVPQERVYQMHMAGHDASGPFIIDTHGDHICDDVFDLYAHTVRRMGPKWTLLEWDNDIPSVDVLLKENQKVRSTAELAAASSQERAHG